MYVQSELCAFTKDELSSEISVEARIKGHRCRSEVARHHSVYAAVLAYCGMQVLTFLSNRGRCLLGNAAVAEDILQMASRPWAQPSNVTLACLQLSSRMAPDPGVTHA